MKEKACKQNYQSPVVEVMNVRVEAGFAGSTPQQEQLPIGSVATTSYEGGHSWN